MVGQMITGVLHACATALEVSRILPPPSHSRRASLGTLASFGFLLWAVSLDENNYQSFSSSLPNELRSSDVTIKRREAQIPPDEVGNQSKKDTQMGILCFGCGGGI